MDEAIIADWKKDKVGDRMMEGDEVFHILMTLEQIYFDLNFSF